MQIAWTLDDLLEKLAALPETGATFVDGDRKTRGIAKAAKAAYNAQALAGHEDAETRALADLKQKGIIQ